MSNGTDKRVTITLNSSGLPVPSIDPVTVKKDSEKVQWCADFSFSIEIEGQTADSTAGPSGCNQTVKKGPWGKVGQIKYSITANGQTNDPTIDIQPGP